MNKLLLVLTILMSPLVATAQNIGSVTGVVDNAGEITINGSGFGDNGPTVTLFDDFESGTTGQILTLGPGGAPFGQWEYFGNNFGDCQYSNLYSLSGSNSYRAITNNNLTRVNTLFNEPQRNYFIQYSVRSPFGCPTGGSNAKMAWVTGVNTICDDMTIMTMTPPTDDCNYTQGVAAHNDYTGIDILYMWDGRSWASDSEWFTIQARVKGNTANDSNDGEATMRYKFSTGATFTTQTWTGINLFHVGTFTGQCGDVGGGSKGESIRIIFPGNVESTGRDLFYDDIYIAEGPYAQARVELGDSPSYANCTKLAICPTTSWADGSITSNVRTGAFNSGADAWAYVTDASGNVSEGFPVIIGSDGGGPPIALTPPTGLIVSGGASAGVFSGFRSPRSGRYANFTGERFAPKRVILDWDLSRIPVDYYQIWRADGPAFNWVHIDDAYSTWYIDTTVRRNRDYIYRLVFMPTSFPPWEVPDTVSIPAGF